MSQLSSSSSSYLPLLQNQLDLEVKEKPLQVSAVKASLQPSKVQPSKKQTGPES